MTFNSWQFLIFFPIVVAVYFALPFRFRWAWLLAASCFFYMAFIPVYILVLFLLIAIDYTAAIFLEKFTGARRRAFLIFSIFSTCAVLFVFKYFNFFNANLAALAKFLHWNYPVENLGLILPIGLSFHTFQSLDYVIEVYRGRFKAERHFGKYALYVMFFPQLVSGPIERAQNLLPQIHTRFEFDYDRVVAGLKLMLWGLFQKVVIADRLALVVNQVYNHPQDYSGPALATATIFFAFQIYCDFAGYSDIAIGAAQVMGFRLMQNFNRPYLAASIGEFWQRWHISLSTWFRDYLYIPLGGNRVGKSRWAGNIMITFLVSGLWHGANWTFIIWGGLHGFYYLCSAMTESMRRRLAAVVAQARLTIIYGAVKRLVVFTLVCFAWVFFRAANAGEAFYIIGNLGKGWGAPLVFDPALEGFIGLRYPEFLLAAALIFLLMGIHVLQEFILPKTAALLDGKPSLRAMSASWPLGIRWAVYLAAIFVIVNFGVDAEIPFIYFQF